MLKIANFRKERYILARNEDNPILPIEERQAALKNLVKWYKHYFRCSGCGTQTNLTFHHENPSLGKYKLSTLIHRTKVKAILEEFLKCDVLCLDCHRKIDHVKLWKECGIVLPRATLNPVVKYLYKAKNKSRYRKKRKYCGQTLMYREFIMNRNIISRLFSPIPSIDY